MSLILHSSFNNDTFLKWRVDMIFYLQEFTYLRWVPTTSICGNRMSSPYSSTTSEINRLIATNIFFVLLIHYPEDFFILKFNNMATNHAQMYYGPTLNYNSLIFLYTRILEDFLFLIAEDIF